MPERRKFERTKVQKAAKIVTGCSEPLLDCVVLNLSVGGVWLKVANVADIPDEFALTFDAARTLRPCRVAWRSKNTIGVAFC
jgi:hypothetical protein